MKSKIFTVLLLSLFLLGSFSLVAAQEKMTEEEALLEIANQKACVEQYKPKVEELKAELEPLEEAVAELDKRIEELEKELAKYEKPSGGWDFYVVKEGDWLAKLAEYKEVYGHGNYAMWPKIYEANKNLIKNPNLIHPGWKLKIPR